MFYYNTNNLLKIKGQQKAYDYARYAFPFLLTHLNAELNSSYNGMITIPVNSGSGRYCHAQFKLFANVLHSNGKSYSICGRMVQTKAEYHQEQYFLAVETYMHGDEFISIRRERVDNLLHLTQSNDGILLLGENYFSTDNSWMNNPDYYTDYEKLWGASEREWIKKDGTKAVWHIRAHKNKYRKFNLYKLFIDGKIHKIANNLNVCTLDNNVIDLSSYEEPKLNIDNVQWDFRKSSPCFYWQIADSSKDRVILSNLNTAHEIYSIFKNTSYTEAALKKLIYNRCRSTKRPTSIKIDDNGTIKELYVSDEKDKEISLVKLSHNEQSRLIMQKKRALLKNTTTESLTSVAKAPAECSLANSESKEIIKLNEHVDKSEYLNLTPCNNSLFGNTQFSQHVLKSSQGQAQTSTPSKNSSIAEDYLLWYVNFKKEVTLNNEYIIKSIESDDDKDEAIKYYYELLKGNK